MTNQVYNHSSKALDQTLFRNNAPGAAKHCVPVTPEEHSKVLKKCKELEIHPWEVQ